MILCQEPFMLKVPSYHIGEIGNPGVDFYSDDLLLTSKYILAKEEEGIGVYFLTRNLDESGEGPCRDIAKYHNIPDKAILAGGYYAYAGIVVGVFGDSKQYGALPLEERIKVGEVLREFFESPFAEIDADICEDEKTKTTLDAFLERYRSAPVYEGF